MEPDWDDLKVLLALARGGSIAGAARELSVDHSTVSRRLAAVEEAFGAPLLVRGGREFAWTGEGRTALAAAEAAEATILAATRQVRTARQDVAGTVRVTTTPGTLALLAPTLEAHLKRYPALELEFLASAERLDLARGAADIALRFAKPTEPDLIGRHVIDNGWAVYASKDYLGRHGAPESPAALRRHRLVLYAEKMQQFGVGLRWLEAYRGEQAVITRVDNLQSAEQLLSMGQGIGSLPCYQGDRSPALLRALPAPITHVAGYLVYHVSLRDAARIRAAVEVLTDTLTSLAAVFSGEAGGGAPT